MPSRTPGGETHGLDQEEARGCVAWDGWAGTGRGAVERVDGRWNRNKHPFPGDLQLTSYKSTKCPHPGDAHRRGPLLAVASPLACAFDRIIPWTVRRSVSVCLLLPFGLADLPASLTTFLYPQSARPPPFSHRTQGKPTQETRTCKPAIPRPPIMFTKSIALALAAAALSLVSAQTWTDCDPTKQSNQVPPPSSHPATPTRLHLHRVCLGSSEQHNPKHDEQYQKKKDKNKTNKINRWTDQLLLLLNRLPPRPCVWQISIGA